MVFWGSGLLYPHVGLWGSFGYIVFSLGYCGAGRPIFTMLNECLMCFGVKFGSTSP